MRLGDGPAKLRFTCSAQLIGRLGDNSGYKKLADQQNRYSEGGQLSPDDQQLAFESMRSGNPEIWKSNADGRNPLQLTFGKDENWAGTPRWSPGRKVDCIRLPAGQLQSNLSDGFRRPKPAL